MARGMKLWPDGHQPVAAELERYREVEGREAEQFIRERRPAIHAGCTLVG
jgi:hypothetical protein